MNQLATDRPSTISGEHVVSDGEARAVDAYWRACNYLALDMLYLRDNPLLREPLAVEHSKRRLVGHWGSDPGQSFVWQDRRTVLGSHASIYPGGSYGV